MTVLLLTTPLMIVGIAVALVPILIAMRHERAQHRAATAAKVTAWHGREPAAWTRNDVA
jgi:hypothetical protein